MLVAQLGAEYLRLGQGKEDVVMGQTTGRNYGPLTQVSAEWDKPSPWNPCLRAGAGNFLSATRNHCVSGNAAFPTPTVFPPSASFCSLFKNCYMAALKCHWPQFWLPRWKWLSKWPLVAGYLLLALSHFSQRLKLKKLHFNLLAGSVRCTGLQPIAELDNEVLGC